MRKMLMTTVFLLLFLVSFAFSDEINILMIMPNNYSTNFNLHRDNLELMGWNITLAGVSTIVQPCPNYAAPLGNPPINVDILVSDIADVTQFDCIAIMSGSLSLGNSCSDLIGNQQVLNIVKAAVDSKIVVAAFSTGVRVLAAAGVINGKTVTGNSTYQSEYISAGATYLAYSPPVIDGNIVTSMMGSIFSLESCDAIGSVVEKNKNPHTGLNRKITDSTISTKILLAEESVEWAKTFGNSGSEGGRSVIQTSDGGFLICGYTYSIGAGMADIYLLKTDSDGNEEWTKTYGGTGWDYGYSAIQAKDKGFIITGYTTSKGNGGRDACLIKTDSLGNEIWFQTYGGDGMDIGRAVIESSQGGLIICGTTKSAGSQKQHIYLIRTDDKGDTLWTKIREANLSDFAHSIIETSDGGFIVAGSSLKSIINGFADRDIIVLKFNADGNELWTKKIHNNYYDTAFSIKESNNNGYIMTGDSDFEGQDALNVLTVKLDSDGTTNWRKQFSESTLYDYSRSVVETKSGEYIICGATKSVAKSNDLYLLRTDSKGNTLHKIILGDTGSDWGNSICLTNNGSYVITGHTYSYGAGKSDVWLLKISRFKSSFGANQLSGHAPLQVQFTDQSSGDISSWEWDFNGDGNTDSHEQNPSWLFEQPGVYTVSLIISDGEQSDTLKYDEYIHVFDGESALCFDGKESYVSCSATPDLNLTEQLTIEAWIKPNGWGELVNLGFGRILDKGKIALFLSGKHPSFNDESVLLQFNHQNGTTSISMTPVNSIILDEWQHVAATYDAVTSEVKMYINGVEQTLTQTVPPSGNIADNSSMNLTMGNNSTGIFTFDGIIDELRVWNIVRSSGQISEKMNCHYEKKQPGLLLCWGMDEGAGQLVMDNAANNNGTISNASWIQGKNLTPTVVQMDNASAELQDFVLENSYPNPVNQNTFIKFHLQEPSRVHLKILDILGRETATLVNGEKEAGEYHIVWNGKNREAMDVPSGIYLCQLKAVSLTSRKNNQETKKMLLLK